MADGKKIICVNKKARFDYQLLETYEAGLSLLGTEVKSLREGRANLKDSYAEIKGNEIFLINTHISQYPQANQFNHDPLRERKLLLHKKEISRLIGKVKERGLTLIPLTLYFLRGNAKIELALAKGKKSYDKREDIKKQTARREIEREMKDRLR